MLGFLNRWIDRIILGIPIRIVMALVVITLIILVLPLTLWDAITVQQGTFIGVLSGVVAALTNTFIVSPIFFIGWALTGKIPIYGPGLM